MSTTTQDRQVRRRLAILQHADEVTGDVTISTFVFRHLAARYRRAWDPRETRCPPNSHSLREPEGVCE
jgi:hypothetical protein